MCDPLPPKQILLVISVHVNEVLYRSQIFIEKSKTLNYFFNIYDSLVYHNPAALIHVSFGSCECTRLFRYLDPIHSVGRTDFTLQEEV